MMKKYLFFALAVLMVACFAPRMVESVAAKQHSKQDKVMSVSATDSVKALIAKARWGDEKAYLKLADCYREGYGVPRDFLSMVAMLVLADEYGMLDLTGTRWLLGAYKRGVVKLKKEDVRRLERIIEVKNEPLRK